MKLLNRFVIYTMLLLLSFMFVTATGCKKDKKEAPPPVTNENGEENGTENGNGDNNGGDIIDCEEEFTDLRDDNVYQIVQIGNQCWFAENLKYLPFVSSPVSGSGTDSYYYVYDYNGTDENEAKTTTNYDTYGVLYNWSAASTACPEGWHLPSDDEWKQLEMALGMSQTEADNTGYRGTNEGSKLAGNTGLWYQGVLTNNQEFGTSGFSAIPGGYRNDNGTFISLSGLGFWWNANEHSSEYAWSRFLYYSYSKVERNLYDSSYGYSVRCVKD